MARERRLVFGEVAELYDRARPSYPPALIDDVVEAAHVAPPDRALEVGTGTGKATELFAERGVGVLGLEPDPDMASMARHRCAAYADVGIEQSDFERWSSEDRRFPLLFSAQAWHWIDPATRYRRARVALQPGGLLAVFWTHPDWRHCALREGLSKAYARIGGEASAHGPMHPDIDPPALVTAWQAEIDTADGLGEAETRVYRWTKTYSTEDYVALLSTHSDHLILPAASRGKILEAIAEVIDGAGGSFPMTYATLLCLARAK
jgi:trans-aconitate methyltransferase